MQISELLLLAIGLAMDAFAVSICKGLASHRIDGRKMLIVGLWFGGFQALMPLIGYLIGSRFVGYISQFDHWIIFGLLALIGGSMILEAVRGGEEDLDDSLDFKTMLFLALATSIDALAAGVTLALMPGSSLIASILVIGVITAVLSMLGLKLGHLAGSRFQRGAKFAGGVILILLGLKILLEHLGVF